ncbi:hypothetical protein FQN50_002596 [Emmonsiellopsis sp. PD_5]|nr:hypothetical protein FQN50_002596 [Emmonsiellopsis sp. PD_5]
MSLPSEPSILEYARFHNVANNTSPDPLSFIPTYSEDIQASLCNPFDTQDIDLRAIRNEMQIRTREKLDVSRSSAALLSSISKLEHKPALYAPPKNSYEEEEYLPNLHRVRNLKCDLPMLKTDHELDMRSFRQNTSLDCMEMDLPLEIVSDEKDEGLALPRGFWDEPRRIWEATQKEKLDCTKEIVMLIQEVKGGSTEVGDVDGGLVEQGFCPWKKGVHEPLTPTLLPREDSPSPFMPSSPCMELEILTEPHTPPIPLHQDVEHEESKDTPTAKREEAATKFLDKINEAACQNSSPGKLSSSATCKDVSDFKISPPGRNRFEDLKVEGPITPPISTRKRPAEEDIDILEAITRAGGVPEWPLNVEMDIEPNQMLEAELTEIARAAMKEIESKLHDERIRVIDAMTRCPVPNLHPPTAIPPWPAVLGLSKAEMKRILRKFVSKEKKEHLRPFWDPIDTRQEKSLEWKPFKKEVKRLAVEETIEPRNALGCFLSDTNIGPRTEQEEIWDLSTLHHSLELFASYDVEELMPRSLSGGEKTAAPQNRANRVQNKTAKEISRKQEKLYPVNKRIWDLKSQNTGRVAKPAKPPLIKPSILPRFSAIDSLSNFMEVRCKTPQVTLNTCPYFPVPTASNKLISTQNIQNPRTTAAIQSGGEIPTAETIPVPLLPIPDIPGQPEALTFVISATLLRKHRRIIRNLELLSPAPILLFRDIANSNLSSGSSKIPSGLQRPPNSPHTGGLTNPQTNDTQEADIALSPTVGVLLTSTQEATHQYLPGHGPVSSPLSKKPSSPVRERISNSCLSYEHLYVFICYPTPATTQYSSPQNAHAELDRRTMEAVNSLKSFCESLSHFTTITPLLIPNDAAYVTEWLVSLANKHYTKAPWSHSNKESGSGYGKANVGIVHVPEDPTTEELFLRQMGLNAFAAQVVLHRAVEEGQQLHSTKTKFVSRYSRTGNPDPESPPMQNALSWFIGISPLERRHAFASVVGERVLARVERRLAVEEG